MVSLSLLLLSSRLLQPHPTPPNHPWMREVAYRMCGLIQSSMPQVYNWQLDTAQGSAADIAGECCVGSYSTLPGGSVQRR